MDSAVFAGVLVAALAAGWMPLTGAPGAELWREGAWAVEGPPGGQCGSMPLLQVKGPGSILEPQNAPILANLEKGLPAVMAKACPNVREVILVSGRTRRLMRLAAPGTETAHAPPAARSPSAVIPASPSMAGSPSAATPPPTAAAPATPEPPAAAQNAGAEEAPRRRVSASGGRAAAPPPAPVSAPETGMASASAVPSLSRRSDLRSLSSAGNIEDKCEVLLNWLESSKTGAAPAVNYRYRPPAEQMGLFRDEPMMAVFNSTYDRTENRWRLEQYEKVMSRCMGMNPSRPTPFNRDPNRKLMQYSQQFEQYRQLLNQAFLGQPGPLEPTNITRYVQQVREQTSWATQAMSSAAAAGTSRSSFDRIREQQQSAATQMALLSGGERSQVADYLGRRQAEMAPVIAEEWIRDASSAQKGAASAKVLQSSHAGIVPVLSTMDAASRTTFEERYRRLMESLIAEPLQAEIAKLQSVPATLPGVLQMTAWKATFDATFRDLRGVASVEAAGHEFNQARVRILAGALPAWMQEVGAIPVDGAAITVKRREMETLFPAREDRASAQFTQYETPLRAKEDQLRLKVEAEMRRQQQEAQAAALARQQAEPSAPRPQATGGAPGGSLAGTRGKPGAGLAEGSFLAKGLHNEGTLASLYRGDFLKIGFDRDELGFVDMYGQYLLSFGRQCGAYLPANKVEMTRQRCTAEMVTRNGYGVEISRYCTNWVTEGIGVYADPEMYSVKTQLDRLAAGDAMRHVGRVLTQRDPIAGVMAMAGNAQAIQADMEDVVQQNGCASAGLKRFEENLRLFAMNQQPIRLGETGPRLSAIAPLPGIPFRDQNYIKLIEDLVSEHSKTWAMNRYLRGSVGGVSVASRDPQGRPAKVVANYTYDGFNGRSQGSVSVKFTEGVPECMYFHDFPATCRTPNRAIVASYSDGAYQEK
ncbi:hypothetical protein [Paludibaculum fermentans]|uniref:hypothetical protein n=1 Tax=Paludibaculum fermentans TaxID=1473598 RepID=UPI003EB9B368